MTRNTIDGNHRTMHLATPICILCYIQSFSESLCRQDKEWEEKKEGKKGKRRETNKEDNDSCHFIRSHLRSGNFDKPSNKASP